MITETEIAALKGIADPLKRRIRFLALLSREVKARTGKTLVVVGGSAVEVYTQGNYMSLDIELKGPQVAVEEILGELGFKRRGMHSTNLDLDIYVHWLGNGPDPQSENLDKLVRVDAGDGLTVEFVGFEDLVVDRLIQAKFWKVADAALWASMVLQAAEESGQLDRSYLEGKAKQEDVFDLLQAIEVKE